MSLAPPAPRARRWSPRPAPRVARSSPAQRRGPVSKLSRSALELASSAAAREMASSAAVLSRSTSAETMFSSSRMPAVSHPRHPREPERPRLRPLGVPPRRQSARLPAPAGHVQRGARDLGLVCSRLGSRGGEGAVKLPDLLLELLNLGCSRLEHKIACFQVGAKCVPRRGCLKHLLSRCVKFEPSLFDDRAEGNVRPRELVTNLVENVHRVGCAKREIGLLDPTDDIGSSLDVSPVEHVVTKPFREEVLDLDGSSVGFPGHVTARSSPTPATTPCQFRRSSSYMTKDRGRPRECCSDSIVCRSQRRSDFVVVNPSRAFKEAATSSGFRTAIAMAGAIWSSARTASQSGSSREIRGSLTTKAATCRTPREAGVPVAGAAPALRTIRMLRPGGLHVVPRRADALQEVIVRLNHHRRFPEAKLVVSLERRDDVPR